MIILFIAIAAGVMKQRAQKKVAVKEQTIIETIK